MTKTFQDEGLFEFSNFGHWKLFDICNFNNSMNFQQSKSHLGITKAWSSGSGFFILYIKFPIHPCNITLIRKTEVPVISYDQMFVNGNTDCSACKN